MEGERRHPRDLRPDGGLFAVNQPSLGFNYGRRSEDLYSFTGFRSPTRGNLRQQRTSAPEHLMVGTLVNTTRNGAVITCGYFLGGQPVAAVFSRGSRARALPGVDAEAFVVARWPIAGVVLMRVVWLFT
jgi:hypothetical protein